MRRGCRKPPPLLVKSTLIMIAAASMVVGCSAAVSPSVPDAQIKCDCNPCGCTQKPPPPPSPPPPKWPIPYCPPPPPAPYLYIVGTPGNLYPFDPNYNPSSARRSYAGPMPVFLVSGLLALWKIWWL
ncbi:unnamed protein product [Musa textilis]